ncbi:PepSY-like domain-containing protein [Methylococcus sp. ANG]|uniref:PepSY domain-containing protein n=1 Tax=unclassified Methylococcus TaxID=2618889 RepID=UPI001C528696|nr:PepSY-like domain-containing protein [Methylococcus sp. Mc7]QXP84079.1 PepSY-like domain-containing protein [Methylococcus sp. Mc7]
MKRNISSVLVFAGALALSAGVTAGEDLAEQQVPKAVLDAFKAVYPNATDVEYEKKVKHGETVYEIEFKDQGVEREIVYSADGKVLKAELDD